MPYHTLSNIILLCAIVGIILLLLRRLPEAVASRQEEMDSRRPVDEALTFSGRLSAKFYVQSRAFVLYWSKRVWNFALEAKGLRHPSLANYRIKKIFRHHRGAIQDQAAMATAAAPAQAAAHARPTMADVSKIQVQAVQNEQYFLDQIKEQPHDLNHYNALGHFYITAGNFSDAQNVYEYLVNRDAASGEYYAKLAYCKLSLKMYDDAATLYEKSLALDSSHPNRYYNLALTYKILARPEDAVGAIGKALVMEPHNPKYQDLLDSVQSDMPL